MLKKLFFLSNLSCLSVFAQESSITDSLQTQSYKISETETFTYPKPRFSDLYKKIPKSIVGTATDIVSKDIYPYSIAAVGATALMIPMDPWIIKNMRSFGNQLGFSEDHTYKKLGPLKIIPADTNSLLYFLGNGTSIIIMGGGFAAYGLIFNDYRSTSVSAQLVQSIILSGVFSQSIKRITGRESPFITDGAGRIHSEWNWFPGFSAYQKDTSRFDAMPSGHLTTAMAAWTVIAENYPEVKWIKPVGYSIMGLMCFEMMQSKVHWASDYPIALLLGYLIGKNIAKNTIVKSNQNNLVANKKRYHFNFASSTLDGIPTYGVDLKF